MNISLLTELPESLHKELKKYLDSHPEWDQDRTIAAALSMFLTQNTTNKAATKHYLDALLSPRVGPR